MGDQQKWIEAARKSPGWVSGGISLATAVIGFVLLLQGNVQLGVTVLGVLLTALLLFGLAYVAFARTTPLIEGGRGVYRFEKYRLWALVGLGLVVGLVIAVLLFRESRLFIVAAITGRDRAVEVGGEAGSGGLTGGNQGERTDASFADECFGAYFSAVGDGRVATLENGATAQVVLDSDQTKEEAAGLYLTDFGRPVGAVTYRVFPESDLFRIESAVDEGCRELGAYAGRSVPDADDVEMRLAGSDYILSLIHDGGTVFASFRQFTP